MEKDKRYDEGSTEDRSNLNPQDVDYKHPAKQDKSREKIDIKESELGRETSQQPANEQMEPMSQIDPGTKKIQDDAAASDENKNQANESK